MPEIVVQITGLPAEQIANIRNLPGQIEALLNTAKQAIDAVQSGANSGNPAGAFFGSLSSLASQAGEMPELSQVVAPVRELVQSLPTGELGNVGDIASSITSLLERLGPLRDALLSGDFDRAFQEAVGKCFESLEGMTRERDELLSGVGGMQEFFQLFTSMLSWRTTTPNPEAVVHFLSGVLVGLPADVLSRPAAEVERILAPARNLLPQGADLTAWRGVPAQAQSFWERVDVQVSAGAGVDWAALAADLQRARVQLAEWAAVRDRLISTTLSGVNALRLDGFGGVAATLGDVPRIEPPPFASMLEDMRSHLLSLLDGLRDWTPTPDELRAFIREFVDSVLDYINDSPLGRFRAEVIAFQQQMIRAVEDLPLRGLAHEAELALQRVASAVNLFDPEVIRRPIHEFFEGVRQKIEDFSAEEIRAAVEQLWQSVEQALTEAGQLIGQLRGTLEQAVQGLGNFVEQAQPTMEQITAQVGQIKTALEEFDLNDPADVVVDELHDVRDTVKEIDVSNVPEPALAALKMGAEMLRSIDLTATIKDPLNAELDKIDPTPALEQAKASIGQVFEQIKSLDPASLGATLDAPVDELLLALGQLGPEALRRLVDEALKPVKDAIHSLDFTQLLAPITDIYRELMAKVDAILNPDLIFKPLEELFQPILDVVDMLDPMRIFALISPHSETLGTKAAAAVAPPAALGPASETLRGALSGVPEIQDEMLGFRPGDMLVPLIDLHHKLSESFDSLDNNVLAPAAALLHRSFGGALNALDPAAITADVEVSLGGARLEFDTVRVSAALAAPALAFHSAAGKLAEAAASAPAAQRAAAQQALALLPELDPLSLVPSDEQSITLRSATLRVEASLDLGVLSGSFAGLRPYVESLLPSFLNTAELSADELRRGLRALDPSPVRDELNSLFDDLGHRMVELKDALMAALDEIGKAVEEFILPLTPGSLLQLGHTLHAAAKEQIASLGPAAFKDEVQQIFDVVKHQLSVLDPTVVFEELNGLRDELIHVLDEFLDALLPDSAAFDALLAQLAQFKPSQLLKELSVTLKPVTELVAKLNPAELLAPLIEAIARVRAQLPEVLAKIEGALDEVLAAIPGGAGGGSASVSVSVG